MIKVEAFESWLKAYGAAWQTRDPQAAARIFTPDAEYFWTPLDPPKVGHAEIAAAWNYATSQQEEIVFRYDVWFVDDMRGGAHWHTSFARVGSGDRVDIDGVLTAEFDANGLCRVFREWWHSTEGG